jgi:hypothetical protein
MSSLTNGSIPYLPRARQLQRLVRQPRQCVSDTKLDRHYNPDAHGGIPSTARREERTGHCTYGFPVEGRLAAPHYADGPWFHHAMSVDDRTDYYLAFDPGRAELFRIAGKVSMLPGLRRFRHPRCVEHGRVCARAPGASGGQISTSGRLPGRRATPHEEEHQCPG